MAGKTITNLILMSRTCPESKHHRVIIRLIFNEKLNPYI